MIPKPNNGLTPERSGIYQPEFAEYQGLDVFITDERLTLFWYTHSKSNRYYICTCPIDAESFDICTTSGGTFDDPAKRTEKVIGEGSLDLDAGGVFRWHTSEHGRGSWEIKPLLLSNHPDSGVYYQPDQVGSGLSVKVYPQLYGIMSAYFYTYDQVGRQIWFLAVGQPEALVVTQIFGAKFNYRGGDEEQVGTASLIDNVFTYDIEVVGVPKQGKLELVRL